MISKMILLGNLLVFQNWAPSLCLVLICKTMMSDISENLKMDSHNV